MSEEENKVEETVKEDVKEQPSQADEATSQADEEAQEDNADDPSRRIEELEKENAELKDQLLRRVADFDNYRKRMIQEKQDAFDYANANLLKDLLDSLDNFDRAVEAAATATDVKQVADGVSMINKNLVSMLETKYNLVSFGNAGDSFDPDMHEALASFPGDVKEPELKEVYLKGYKLKDKIIRHAKVVVTMPQ